MEESIVYLQKPTQLSLSRITAVDSSLVWIQSCKANPVKCNDLDEYSRKTQSPQEQQQQQDEGCETTTGRTKRSRCTRAEKSAHPKSLEFPPLLSRVDEGSLKPSSNAGKTSSKSIEFDSSASNSKDPDGDQVSEASSVVGRENLKLMEELKSHNNQQNVYDKDQNRDGINRKTRDCLDSEVDKLHQSSFARNSVDFWDHDAMEIVLVDVQMTVNSSPLAEENIPFVSLTSEAYGEAVMGYSLDVGEIRDGSETSLLSKGSVECKLFDDRMSRLDQLVWRKSRRTPVRYVTNSVSASEQAKKNVKNSMLPEGENNGLLGKEKSLMKLLKDTKQTNHEKTAMKKTCVPVELIFSKILAAVD